MDGYEGLSPVGEFTKDKSWRGCMGMAGNAREWVLDWHLPYPEAAQVDPKGPDRASGNRTLRGGGFNSYPGKARGASRSGRRPEERRPMLGLRVALSPRE